MTNLRYSLFGLLVLQLIFSGKAMAQGNLLLMPRRVIFEGTKRYEELNLANTGRDTARYVISLMHIRMKEDGGFEEINQPDSGADFADKFIRFFPHSVTLGPSESQVVKIQLTKINELTPGEYRSHIYFRAIPNKAPLGESKPAADSAISIHLVPIFGISIPVIIRVGETSAKVSLTDISVHMAEDTLPMLNVTFRRTGNMSVYGDISVDYTSIYGNTHHVGSAKGIAVYTPNQVRKFQLSLDKGGDINYHSGKLHIVYTTPADARSAKIAETDMILR
ncbi:MAG TPA: hypothetical protein VE035_12100 [Puia sp.]|nr:hypothetical protein [Puia sp.]